MKAELVFWKEYLVKHKDIKTMRWALGFLEGKKEREKT